MNGLLKKLLVRSKTLLLKNCKQVLYVIVLLPVISFSQIANYVGNGSFEITDTCGPSITNAVYWNALDSVNGGFSFLASRCSGSVPNYNAGYQRPRHGNNYIAQSTFFCQTPICPAEFNRAYLRNRLKQNLQSGRTYCVKFYVNIANASTYGIDGFGAFFGNETSLDTIKKFAMPLSYLSPQIQNTNNNIITDTLNWTLITGTFMATGIEKFMLIGNFKSDAATNGVLINPTNLPTIVTDICTDNVSCIDIDLPAFAGRDTSVLVGDSIYIGRESDVGIDEACFWYQLPTIITPTTPAIDTVAGFWIKPLINCAYVVRQEICGNVKFDTVRIQMNPVGLVSLSGVEDYLKLFPNPASDFIELRFKNKALRSGFNKVFIFNNLGQLLREEEFTLGEENPKIKTDALSDGVYFLQLKSNTKGIVPITIGKRFVIAR